MGIDIRTQIKNNKKVMTNDQYKRWLQQKLDQHGIDRNRLIAVVIVVERVLQIELSINGSFRNHWRGHKPYYRLWRQDNITPTQAWVHAAELALWLKYHGFKAGPYVHSISGHPHVRRFLGNKDKTKQIPFGVLFPSARVSTERLREFSEHYKAWQHKN